MDAVEYATLEWVDWFNHRRLLEPIGSIPPAEAEANYFAPLKENVIAAFLKPNSLRGYRRGSPHRPRMREKPVIVQFWIQIRACPNQSFLRGSHEKSLRTPAQPVCEVLSFPKG
jgi:hypothetical protein